MAWSRVRPHNTGRGAGWSQVHPGNSGNSGGAWRQVPPPRSGWSQVRPERAGYRQVSGANKYAAAMLKKLAGQGYTPKQFGITGTPAAQWRAISAISGALQAARAGGQGSYNWNPGAGGANPGVAGVVASLLGHPAFSDQRQMVNPPPPQNPGQSWLTAPGGPMNFDQFRR